MVHYESAIRSLKILQNQIARNPNCRLFCPLFKNLTLHVVHSKINKVINTNLSLQYFSKITMYVDISRSLIGSNTLLHGVDLHS